MKNYINKHFDNLQQQLDNYVANGGVDALHDLRVELKKVRAVVKFVKLHLPRKKYKKINAPVKELFSAGGTLRDMQIFGQLLVKDKLKKIYTDLETDNDIAKDEKKLRKKAEKFLDKLDKTKQHILECEAVNNKEIIKDYIKNIHLTLEERISIGPPRMYWHDIRKQMKQCLYAASWLNEEIIADATLKKYDAAQDLLGKWHDDTMYEMFLKALKRNYKSNKDFFTALAIPLKNNKTALKQKEKEIKARFISLLPANDAKKLTYSEIVPT